MMTRHRRTSAVLIPAVAGLLASVAAPTVRAAVFPYFNDFSTSVADFTEASDAQWTLNTTTGVYKNSSTTIDSTTAATLQLTNLGGAPATATSFREQTTFKINTITGPNTTIGFSALGADNNPADGTGIYYLADVQQNGTLRLFEVNPNTSLASGTFAGGALQTGVNYTLTLDGTYSGTTLNLALTLTNGADTTTVNFADTTALTGQFFGLRDRPAATGASLDVDFDNFSVTATPEPASAGVIALGGLALAARRHRRR
jgi:hypothetical protein